MGNGIYRIKNGWRYGENSAVLGSQAGMQIEIAEHDYRDFESAPPFDDLPWQIIRKDERPMSGASG